MLFSCREERIKKVVGLLLAIPLIVCLAEAQTNIEIKSKPYGATKILSTTQKFLEHFGIDAKRPNEIKKFLADKIGAK